jgi:vacuolar iron transporter family protein
VRHPPLDSGNVPGESGPGEELARLLRNWRAEQDSAALYDALAQRARSPQQRTVYQELAGAERRHGAFWEERLRLAGERIPPFRVSLRTQFLIALARYLGVAFVIPSIIVREMKDRDGYTHQNDAHIAGLAHEEQRHAVLLRDATDRAFGNNLRAAVLGANDGLTSIFCLMMGVAGSGASSSTIVLAGLAGLVSGAGAMAMGEWLSVTNARELELSLADREAGEPGVARAALDRSAGSRAALIAATFSFLLFALGAMVPLLPVCILPAPMRIAGSALISLAALFVLGVATSLFNARSALFSGLRQTAIGAATAAVTYLAGHLFGVLTAGRF